MFLTLKRCYFYYFATTIWKEGMSFSIFCLRVCLTVVFSTFGLKFCSYFKSSLSCFFFFLIYQQVIFVFSIFKKY